MINRTDSTRTWVWTSLLVQGLGYAFDAFWHGVLRPGADPTTFEAMLHHLVTVHLVLYVGAASVLVSTATLLARGGRGAAYALAGAGLSAGAEAWHAYSHLQLDTHAGPVAGTLSYRRVRGGAGHDDAHAGAGERPRLGQRRNPPGPSRGR